MSAIDQRFAELRSAGRKALMPFITAGDPDLDFTRRALAELAGAGGSILELGLPYSDPIADGPVIQASYTRALAKRITLGATFEMLASVTPELSAPVVTMTSYAIVYRQGVENYLQRAQAAGVAGAIVPDLPVDESAALAKLCGERDFSLIQLVTPTTGRERAVRIAEQSTGFLYYVSVTGITGARQELPPELVENVAWLRERAEVPICIGFGISRPDQVRLLRDVADGVIVGSAIVRRMEQADQRDRDELLKELGEFTGTLAAALD